jgi:hypothetical protein
MDDKTSDASMEKRKEKKADEHDHDPADFSRSGRRLAYLRFTCGSVDDGKST